MVNGLKRSALLGATLPLAALLVLGCDTGEEGALPEEAAAPAAPAPPSPAEPAGAAPAAPAPGEELEYLENLPADTVQVTITEGLIEMPETLPPGRTVFMISNEGGMDHTIEIAVESPEARLDPPAAPGETRSLTFTLSRGTFEFYCPIGNHRQQGEERELHVAG